MPRLVTLEDDGPLGPAGAQVWVNDDPEPEHGRHEAPEKPKPRTSAAKKTAK